MSKARSDWQIKLRISFSIQLQATRVCFAPENIVIVAGIKELTSYFFLYHLTMPKQHLNSVSVAGGGYLPRRFAAQYYQPLDTSAEQLLTIDFELGSFS